MDECVVRTSTSPRGSQAQVTDQSDGRNCRASTQFIAQSVPGQDNDNKELSQQTSNPVFAVQGHQKRNHILSALGKFVLSPLREERQEKRPHHVTVRPPELFYDLFFVANLTTFTSLVEINDTWSLWSYSTFFILLWLTWYQVSLFDVRFSTEFDSIFDRIARVVHIGTMVTFAVLSSQWTGYESDVYQDVSFVLMGSRFTLFFQYTVAFLYQRKGAGRKWLPQTTIMITTSGAAIIYGALAPALRANALVSVTWFFIGIVEIVVIIRAQSASAEDNHLVERMSLLTLIILGEGIIVVCKAISNIIKNSYIWTSPIIGQVVAATLIIYFLYMLYFDRLHEEESGSISEASEASVLTYQSHRSQKWRHSDTRADFLWSLLHLPFHIALVLALQGISFLIIWRQAVEALRGLNKDLNTFLTNYTISVFTNGTQFSDTLKDITHNHVFGFTPKGIDDSIEVNNLRVGLDRIRDGFDSNNKTEINGGYVEVLNATLKTLFDSLSVSVSDELGITEGTRVSNKLSIPTISDSDNYINNVLLRYTERFVLVFIYVFSAVSLSSQLKLLPSASY